MEHISLDEKVELAHQMIEAAEERNEFARRHGGGDFEGFASFGQHIGDNRKQYDALEQKFSELAQRFDAVVPDRKAFVRMLRTTGRHELATKFAKAFNVSEGLFAKLFG